MLPGENDSATDNQGDPEISEESCSFNYAWEQWNWETTDNGAADYFANWYSENVPGSLCLYDNTQEPAIETGCNGVPTNQFQWFTTSN